MKNSNFFCKKATGLKADINRHREREKELRDEMPGVKRLVYEICPKCGEQDARLRDDGMVVWGMHTCKFGPQGRPHEPPHISRPSSVEFVPKVPNAKVSGASDD